MSCITISNLCYIPLCYIPQSCFGCVCLASSSFLDYIARKRAGDTFLHIFRGIRQPWLAQFQWYLAICLSQALLKIPGRERVGNQNHSPKSNLEPPAQLPSCSVLISPLSLFDTPKCIAHYTMSTCFMEKTAPWRKPTCCV